MDRKNFILSGIQDHFSESAEMYGGKKRSDLKDTDFLFPATRSFPIVTPMDVKHAINNFGRMKSNMTYDAFLRKLYNMAKRKGPEFVAALPEATKEKLGINKKTKAQEEETPEMELEEYKMEFAEMSLSSLKAMYYHIGRILNNAEDETVMENLTEPFLQGKIAVAEDYVRMIHDYLMYATETDDTTDAGDKPGLWENIRKKRERMGKNYKPAKPGDKDRPDPEQWKKLTK